MTQVSNPELPKVVKFTPQAMAFVIAQDVHANGWDTAADKATSYLLGLCQQEGLPVDVIKPALEKIVAKMHSQGVFLFTRNQINQIVGHLDANGLYLAGAQDAPIVQALVQQMKQASQPQTQTQTQAVVQPAQAVPQPSPNVIPMVQEPVMEAPVSDTPPGATQPQ